MHYSLIKAQNDNIDVDNTIKIIFNVIHNTTLSGCWNIFKIKINHSMVNSVDNFIYFVPCMLRFKIGFSL